jgi:hypothetical protein
MKRATERNKFQIALKMAILGGLFCSFVTLLAGFCNYRFGAGSGAGGLIELIAGLAQIPFMLVIQHVQENHSHVLRFLWTLSGWPAAAALNFVIGMVLFGVFGCLWKLAPKGIYET